MEEGRASKSYNVLRHGRDIAYNVLVAAAGLPGAVEVVGRLRTRRGPVPYGARGAEPHGARRLSPTRRVPLQRLSARKADSGTVDFGAREGPEIDGA